MNDKPFFLLFFFYWDHFMKFLLDSFSLSDIMTHLFHLKLFVRPEVILIKYFYISTEIFSCHYDMMNYTVHEICYSHWWLYFFLPQQRTKGQKNERRNKLNVRHCAVLFNIFFQTFIFIIFKKKSWQISRRQHEKSFQPEEFLI